MGEEVAVEMVEARRVDDTQHNDASIAWVR